MSSTAVALRELERHASALVDRAARGERIVITRGGHPEALLGPVDGGLSAAAESPRMAAWHAERQAFDRLAPRLVPRYRGRYVAVSGGRVVGSDVDAGRLFERLWKKLRGRPLFIGRAGGPPPLVDMPGFEVAE